jgi:putative ABC transport system permease protein
MLQSYFKIAIRNLAKHKLYSAVNIAGLTVALTACLLIGLYVWNELRYDRFHANADRIARVTMEYSNAGSVNNTAVTGTRVGPEFKRRFPEIESFSRTIIGSRVISKGEKVFTEDHILFADSAFFQMFSFQLLQGDANTCLNGPEKLVLTQQAARKYFGNEDPLGQSLRLADGTEMMVSGIISDVPGNSQMQFDMVMPFMNLGAAKQEEQWFTANYVTYILLQNKSSFSTLQQKITAFMKGVSREELFPDSKDYLTHKLEKLTDVHLFSTVGGGLEPAGNIVYVYVLSIIAFLILLIACVNYTNLAVAQSTGRTVEVGIRKVLGAQRKQLIAQFLGESLVIVVVSLMLSLVLCFLLLPYFNDVSGTSIGFTAVADPMIMAVILGAAVLVSAVTGLYPALLLSGKKLGSVMKSGTRISFSGGYMRKMMIVFQFVVSVFLITASIIVTQQLGYIRNRELGYDKEHLMILPIDNKTRVRYEELKAAIASQPGVLGVSGGYESPSFVKWSDGISFDKGYGKNELSVKALPVGLDFVSTLSMKLTSGRDFSRADLLAMDTTDNYKNFQYSFILNEKAVSEIGWTAEEAIGKTISKGSPGLIRGVVKDFNFTSLHEPIGPMVIFLEPNLVFQMFVRVKGENMQSALTGLEKVWRSRVPHRPFEFRFLDEEYYSLYKAEQRTAQIFGLFSGLAILLACLGLFALAAFTTVQRTKEIGIRKVLGASISGIALMLSKEFLLLVGIAILISIPVAWYAGSRWLQDFAYRVELSWWMFAAAGVIGILIAIIAVSAQAIRAAVANPVTSLRSE